MRKLIDLTGQKFGVLTPIKRYKIVKYNLSYHKSTWKCLCDCGKFCFVRQDYLRSGKKLDCGCVKDSKFINKKFDRLLVLEKSKERKDGRVLWKCLCNCGTIKLIPGKYLIYGITRSCGCLQKELMSKRMTKHGYSGNKNPTYRTWAGMIDRCHNKNANKYYMYGAKNITVYKRWRNNKNGFQNFLEDMGEKPEGKTLDRIKNKFGYRLSNCRWATIAEQNRNRKSNINIKFNNKKQCLQDWSSDTGIKASTIKRRLDDGWTIEEALTTQVRKTKFDKNK